MSSADRLDEAAVDPWDAIKRLRADRWALSECVAALFPERFDLAEELDAMEDERDHDFRTQPPDRADRALARANRRRAIIRELGGHGSWDVDAAAALEHAPRE